jgi:hypothetical protein
MLSKKGSLDTLSNQDLCKLRDEIDQLLETRAESLQRELDQLLDRTAVAKHRRKKSKKG